MINMKLSIMRMTTGNPGELLRWPSPPHTPCDRTGNPRNTPRALALSATLSVCQNESKQFNKTVNNYVTEKYDI